jgi:hypothetical protein
MGVLACSSTYSSSIGKLCARGVPVTRPRMSMRADLAGDEARRIAQQRVRVPGLAGAEMDVGQVQHPDGGLVSGGHDAVP